MCLYPRLVPNPKYKPNKKNGGVVPKPPDKRVLMVPIGCGHCIECRRQLARSWKIRLSEEIEANPTNNFVTLTLSDESIDKLTEYYITHNDGATPTENDIAKTAVRLFLERWRKKHKKSLRHWLVTELGDEGTERIHLHGMIWWEDWQEINDTWQYGWTDNGYYVNQRSINYQIKYIFKQDEKHPEFEPKILCSPGIGRNYIDTKLKRFNQYAGKDTREYYRTAQGYKLNLPIYYRNYAFNEEEREKLWLQKLDEKKIWVLGTAYDISTSEGIENYCNALKVAQRDNIKNGYGKITWKKKDYKKQLIKINSNFVDNFFE